MQHIEPPGGGSWRRRAGAASVQARAGAAPASEGRGLGEPASEGRGVWVSRDWVGRLRGEGAGAGAGRGFAGGQEDGGGQGAAPLCAGLAVIRDKPYPGLIRVNFGVGCNKGRLAWA